MPKICQLMCDTLADKNIYIYLHLCINWAFRSDLQLTHNNRQTQANQTNMTHFHVFIRMEKLCETFGNNNLLNVSCNCGYNLINSQTRHFCILYTSLSVPQYSWDLVWMVMPAHVSHGEFRTQDCSHSIDLLGNCPFGFNHSHAFFPFLQP